MYYYCAWYTFFRNRRYSIIFKSGLNITILTRRPFPGGTNFLEKLNKALGLPKNSKALLDVTSIAKNKDEITKLKARVDQLEECCNCTKGKKFILYHNKWYSSVPNNWPCIFILIQDFFQPVCLIRHNCLLLKFPCTFIYFWTFSFQCWLIRDSWLLGILEYLWVEIKKSIYWNPISFPLNWRATLAATVWWARFK